MLESDFSFFTQGELKKNIKVKEGQALWEKIPPCSYIVRGRRVTKFKITERLTELIL